MGVMLIWTREPDKLRHREIEQHFGKRITHVFNAHYHFDHTNGNQVFGDAEIIAHRNGVAGMKDFAKKIDDFVVQREAMSQLCLSTSILPSSGVTCPS